MIESVKELQEKLMSFGGNILGPVKKGFRGAHLFIEHSDDGIDGLSIILKQEGSKPENIFHLGLRLKLVKQVDNSVVNVMQLEVADDLGDSEGRRDKDLGLLVDFEGLV